MGNSLSSVQSKGSPIRQDLCGFFGLVSAVVPRAVSIVWNEGKPGSGRLRDKQDGK